MTDRHKRQAQVVALAWCSFCAVSSAIGVALGWVAWNGRKA